MERDYIFGTTTRNGVTVENLKTVGDTHTALVCGNFSQVRREYPDSIITDLFRVDELYNSMEADGVCYDYYTISEHWRDTDKSPTKTEAQGYVYTHDASGTAHATLFGNKVDKVAGKGLSTEDYTSAEKTKLSGIEASANNYVHPSEHAISVITGLQTALDGKVDDSQVLTNVPAGAVFTDTVYVHPTTSGNKHIPSGGSSGQVLKYSADGTAVWGTDNDTITTINGNTGAIAKADIVALGIPAQDTVYTHPANHAPSIITQDANNRFVSDTEKSTWNGKAASSHTHTKSQITDFPTSMTPTAHNQAGTTITVADSGGYFTGTNAETVLQEIGSTLNGLEAAITAIVG